MSLWPNETHSADRLVLRDLTILRDVTVTQMSVDGLQLSDGRVLTWDTIESGRLDGGRQASFDRFHSNLGDDLYRIRRRLGSGDYAGALPHAEKVAKYYRGRHSDTAYLAMQALMWGRLAKGQREAATAPYLRCLEIVRSRGQQTVSLPGERKLTFDAATGLSAELPPVWFDADAAKAAMPEVLAAVGQMKQPRPPAARAYYVSLAIAAGDMAAANPVIAGFDRSKLTQAQLRQVLLAQQEVASGKPAAAIRQLANEGSHYKPAVRPLAIYWLGRGQLASEQLDEQQQGMLRLLEIPAVYANGQPALSAAALYEVMQAMQAGDDQRGSLAVRGELLAKYAGSYHAALLTNQIETGADQP